MLAYIPMSGSHPAELKETLTIELSQVGFFNFLRFSKHRDDYLVGYILNEIFNELQSKDSLLMRQIIEDQISAITVFHAAKFIDRFGVEYSIERIFTQLVAGFGLPVQPIALVEYAPLLGNQSNASEKRQITSLSQLYLDLIFKANTSAEKNVVRQIFQDNPLSPECHAVLRFHREYTDNHACLLTFFQAETTLKDTLRELMQMSMRGHLDPNKIEVTEALAALNIPSNIALAKLLSLDESKVDFSEYFLILFNVKFEGLVLIPLLYCKALTLFKAIPELERSDVLLNTLRSIDKKIQESGNGFINSAALLIFFKTLISFAPVDSRPLLVMFRKARKWPNHFNQYKKEKFKSQFEKIILHMLFAPARAYDGKLVIGSYGKKSFDLLLTSGVMRLSDNLNFYSLQTDFSNFDKPAKKVIATFCMPYLEKPIDYLTPELTSAEIQTLVDSNIFTTKDWKTISNNEHARKKFSHIRLPEHVLPLVNERMHEMALTVDLGL